MQYSKQLDWLQCTKNGRFGSLLESLPEGIKLEMEIKSETKRWTHAYLLLPSGTLMIDRRTGWQQLLWTGKPLQILRAETNIDDRQLLQSLMSPSANFPRIDYAVDLIGDKAPLTQVIGAAKRKLAKTNAKYVHHHTTEDEWQGRTLEVGSPTSDKRVVIYDKSAQQHIMGTSWTRIELRTRNKIAKRLASTMIKSGVSQTGDAVARKFLTFPTVAWYNDALDGIPCKLELPETKEDNWRNWITSAVLPSIEKHATNEADNEFLQGIMSIAIGAVMKHANRFPNMVK